MATDWLALIDQVDVQPNWPRLLESWLVDGQWNPLELEQLEAWIRDLGDRRFETAGE